MSDRAQEWAAATARAVMGERKRARTMSEPDIRFQLQHAFEAGRLAANQDLRDAIREERLWLMKVIAETEGDTHVRTGARTRMQALCATLDQVPA